MNMNHRLLLMSLMKRKAKVSSSFPFPSSFISSSSYSTLSSSLPHSHSHSNSHSSHPSHPPHPFSQSNKSESDPSNQPQQQHQPQSHPQIIRKLNQILLNENERDKTTANSANDTATTASTARATNTIRAKPIRKTNIKNNNNNMKNNSTKFNQHYYNALPNLNYSFKFQTNQSSVSPSQSTQSAPHSQSTHAQSHLHLYNNNNNAIINNIFNPNDDPSIVPESYRATAFSTAENYDFSSLLPILQKNYILMPYISDDVFHIRIPNSNNNTQSQHPVPSLQQQHLSELQQHQAESDSESDTTSQLNNTSTQSSQQDHEPHPNTTDPDAPTSAQSSMESTHLPTPEAFIFDNGTLVTWGASSAQIARLLEIAREVSISSYAEKELEWFEYCIDLERQGGITSETIMVLGKEMPLHQSMLAFSAGLARSAKLASLELLLDQHLDKHRHIPNILLRGKKLPLDQPAVLKNLGELFALRGQVNHHSELLDPPDFVWASSRMESLFESLSRHLDVRSRISTFNKKLDYASDFAEMLRTHLHERHSTHLEMAVVILISVEIFFTLLHFVEDHGFGPFSGTVLNAENAVVRKSEGCDMGKK